MKTYVAFFAASLLLSLALTPAVRLAAIRLGIIDRPGGRKIHYTDVPRLGGVAVAFSAVFPFLGFLFYSNLLADEMRESWRVLAGLALGSAIVFAVGVWDDVRGLPPWPKLFAEVGAAAVAFALGLRIEILSNPFGFPIDAAWLSGPVTILWLVGITNAVNLADGVDGLAAGIAAFAAGTLFFMTLGSGYGAVSLLAAALAGASLGFLRYNFHPATIFLGDSGSLFLGFFLGGLSLWASEKSTITFALVIPVVALGLPLADMLYAILRRWYRGMPVGQGDKEHIHHKLLDMGFSHGRAVLLLYGVNVLLMGVAGFLLYTRNSGAAYVLVVLGIGLVVGLRVLGYLRFSRIARDVAESWRESRRAKYAAFRVRMLERVFEEEQTQEARWAAAVELFRDLGFSKAALTLAGQDTPAHEWTSGEIGAASPGRSVVLSVPVVGENGDEARLFLSCPGGGGGLPAGVNGVIDVMRTRFLSPPG